MIDKKNGITLTMLAQQCSTSVSTMHRFLKHPHLLNKVKRASIQDVLQTTLPSLLPKSQAIENICIFIHNTQAFLDNEYIKIVQSILKDQDISLTLINESMNTDLKPTLLKYKKVLHNTNGVIAFTYNTYEDFSDIEIKYNIPIITIHPKGNKKGVSLHNDNYTAGKEAAKFLSERSYNKIGFVGWDMEDSHVYDRYIGWKQYCHHNHIAHEQVFEPISIEGGYIACKELMETFAPDALFFACDEMALGGLQYLQEHSFIIGKDIGVLGFDNIPISKYIGLSSFDQCLEKKISYAIDFIITQNNTLLQKEPLIQRETHIQKKNSTMFYTPFIIERQSTQRENIKRKK